MYVNMTKCPEKHTYDADKFERCPFCEKIKADKEKKNVPTVKLEKNKKGKAVKVKARTVKVRAVSSGSKQEELPAEKPEAVEAPKAEPKPVEVKKDEPKSEPKHP